MKDQTLFEVFYGYKPSLKFLKIFGCLCFTHVLQSKQDKLDKRSLAGIFIGYNIVSKAHKIFQPQTEKVVVSNFGIKFTRTEEFKLTGFSDSDWGDSIDDMKSTSGYCFSFGSGAFSWSSKKQDIVA